MSFLDNLYGRRKKLSDVLADEEYYGIRRIVEELYPDRAHFIYELLQNAEDTGATEVNFFLNDNALFFEHNGRSFDKEDVEGITNIGKGAKESQEKHEELLESSEDITKLREKEEETYKRFFESKQKFIEMNTQIKQNLERLKELNNALGETKEEQKQKREKRRELSIKEKIKSVEDKIKKGENLTTEDFIIMQAGN